MTAFFAGTTHHRRSRGAAPCGELVHSGTMPFLPLMDPDSSPRKGRCSSAHAASRQPITRVIALIAAVAWPSVWTRTQHSHECILLWLL